MDSDTGRYATVLFDGKCNLCNASVKFIVRHDPDRRFRFAALQSSIGKKLVQQYGGEPNDLNSVLLVQGDRLYERSSAALRIARRLAFPWSLLSLFLVVPAPLRDLVYRWIARNRYRWFGKTDACMMPTADLLSRFDNDETVRASYSCNPDGPGRASPP